MNPNQNNNVSVLVQFMNVDKQLISLGIKSGDTILVSIPPLTSGQHAIQFIKNAIHQRYKLVDQSSLSVLPTSAVDSNNTTQKWSNDFLITNKLDNPVSYEYGALLYCNISSNKDQTIIQNMNMNMDDETEDDEEEKKLIDYHIIFNDDNYLFVQLSNEVRNLLYFNSFINETGDDFSLYDAHFSGDEPDNNLTIGQLNSLKSIHEQISKKIYIEYNSDYRISFGSDAKLRWDFDNQQQRINVVRNYFKQKETIFQLNKISKKDTIKYPYVNLQLKYFDRSESDYNEHSLDDLLNEWKSKIEIQKCDDRNNTNALLIYDGHTQQVLQDTNNAKPHPDTEDDYYLDNPTAIFIPASYVMGFGLLGAILTIGGSVYGSIEANKAIIHAGSDRLGHTWTKALTIVTPIIITLVALFVGAYFGGKLGLAIGRRKRDNAAKEWMNDSNTDINNDERTPLLN